MRLRTIGTIATLILLIAPPALAETDVGVAAAVNQSAKGQRAGNIRTISLGDNVVYNERVQTGADGLVQVLLADGTTFMVGPNSDLVIDSFVYDPNASTAQVTASFTKGVLRFIGGQTSKTEGGATLNTPVGTMGIRGAMVDVVLDPPAGTPRHIDLLFGNEVTLEEGRALLGRLYAAGYSLVLGPGGKFEVKKTPPGWSSQIQQALAGKPGTKGGAPAGPTDDEVGKSELAETNFPSEIPGFTQRELDVMLHAAASYDELREFIVIPPPTQGLMGGILSIFDNRVVYPLYNDFDATTFDPAFIDVEFDENGKPVSIDLAIATPSPLCAGRTGCTLYQGGTTTGQMTANIVGLGQISIVTTSYLYDHNDVPDVALASQLEAELDCTGCEDLVRWGFWGFNSDTGVVDGETVTLDGLVEANGLWVTGDLTTEAQLTNLATLSESGGVNARYTGDAVANVSNNGANYVATGNLLMDWNFAKRSGNFSISGFDDAANYNDDLEHFDGGASLLGRMESIDGQIGFSGGLDGTGSGFAQGAFVNNGNDAAAGVMGNFGFTYGESYGASGIFFGER